MSAKLAHEIRKPAQFRSRLNIGPGSDEIDSLAREAGATAEEREPC